jgi:hypothetical protein
MKKNSIYPIFVYLFISISFILSLQSCEKENEGCDEENISMAGEDDSHNKGQNCMQCHVEGGEGDGCFVVAGTVYDSLQLNTVSSGKMEFYTEPNGQGQKIETVQIDSKGNFFTTDLFNFQGLYPAVTGPNGITNYMGSPLSSGQCNSCHGVSTSRIWVN